MERGKEAFLERFGKDYGYPDAAKSIDDIRASEFKRLEGPDSTFCIPGMLFETLNLSYSSSVTLGLVYLDHAGATLYSEAQMEAFLKDLTTNVYGNPRIR